MAKLREEIAPVTKPAKRAAVNRSRVTSFVIAALLIVVLVPTAIALYLFTRPVMRLRTEAPSGFAEVNPNWNPKRRGLEDQLARAYWEHAVRDVQPLYHYGAILPADPPAAFQIDPKAVAPGGAKIDLAATRALYWQKLREVWSLPQTWEQADTWNTEWLDKLG